MSEPFSKEQRIEAGMEYYQWQSYTQTAEKLSIRWGREVSKQILKYWDDNSEDFREGKKRGALSVDRKLTSKFAKIAEKSAELVLEHLEDPDKRKELKPKDVAWIGFWAHDKRQVAEGKATSIRGPDKGFSERLAKMEETLAERNQKRSVEKITSKVTRFPSK